MCVQWDLIYQLNLLLVNCIGKKQVLDKPDSGKITLSKLVLVSANYKGKIDKRLYKSSLDKQGVELSMCITV